MKIFSEIQNILDISKALEIEQSAVQDSSEKHFCFSLEDGQSCDVKCNT